MNFLSADLHICDHGAAAEGRCSTCNPQWDQQRFSLDDTVRHTRAPQRPVGWSVGKNWHEINSSPCNHKITISATFIEKISRAATESWISAPSREKLCILDGLELFAGFFHGPKAVCKYEKKKKEKQAICKCMQINYMQWKAYFASVCTDYLNSLLDSFQSV